MMYSASEIEFARKKIHAKQTRLKVKKICIPFSTHDGKANGKRQEGFLLLHKTEATMKTPCNPPQTINAQFVPCQSPLASIVSMGGSASTRRLAELRPLLFKARLSG